MTYATFALLWQVVRRIIGWWIERFIIWLYSSSQINAKCCKKFDTEKIHNFEIFNTFFYSDDIKEQQYGRGILHLWGIMIYTKC